MFNIEDGKDIVFLDIEADHKNNKLIQFGAIKYSNGKYWKVDWYSNPECKISQHVLELIGKNKLNILKNSDNNKTVLAKIFKFLENSYFVSFGDFDYNFLNTLFKEHFNLKPKILGFIDLQKEWKQLFQSESSISLRALADLFEIGYNENFLHDAFVDVELMFKIYMKWSHASKETLISKLYNFRRKNDFVIKHTEKIDLNFSKEQVSDSSQGYVLFSSMTKKVTSKKTNKHEKYLIDIGVISINNDEIIENWHEDLHDKFYNDVDLYEHFLIYSLKKFLQTIKNKKILLYENQIKDYKFISRLCLKYLNKRPVNSCIIINGIDKLIDFDSEAYKSINLLNKDLIIKWKIISSIRKKIKTYEV